MKLTNSQIELLNEMIKEKYISVSKHPDYDLWIYKYTSKCMIEEKWNDVTLMCRGLVLDVEYKVVSYCIPKFFNHNEKQAKIHFDQPFEVFEKYDGSLIQIFVYKSDIIVTSSGSLDYKTSKYIQQATNLLTEDQKEYIWHNDDVTFIFELISPLTKVVVDYKNKVELRLLAITENNGTEFSYNTLLEYDCFKPAKKITTFTSLQQCIDTISTNEFLNQEGYVVKFQNGDRIKLKYGSYLKIHKIVSRLSRTNILDCISNNLEVDLNNVPDEFVNFIKETKDYIKRRFTEINNTTDEILEKVNNLETRKEKAIYIISNHKSLSSILFNKIDGKTFSKEIYNIIQPELKEMDEFERKVTDDGNIY